VRAAATESAARQVCEQGLPRIEQTALARSRSLDADGDIEGKIATARTVL